MSMHRVKHLRAVMREESLLGEVLLGAAAFRHSLAGVEDSPWRNHDGAGLS